MTEALRDHLTVIYNTCIYVGLILMKPYCLSISKLLSNKYLNTTSHSNDSKILQQTLVRLTGL